MEEAAEGHFTTEALQWNQDKSPTISGKVKKHLVFLKILFVSRYNSVVGIMKLL